MPEEVMQTNEAKGGEKIVDAPVADQPAEKKAPGRWQSIFPVLAIVIFALTYYLSQGEVKGGQPDDISNREIVALFKKLNLYIGFALALSSFALYGLLIFVRRLFRLGKINLLRPFLLAGAFLPWFLLARQLVFFEPRYTDLARALIDFVGWPLYYGSLAGLITALIWLAAALGVKFGRRGRKPLAVWILIGLCPWLLTGCVGDLMAVVCDFLPESDHCWQGAAVQEGKQEECEKIKGESFSGSNPPRDKCYLLIAENTGDLSACEQIQGGFMSYTREECLLSLAVKFTDPSACAKLSGGQKDDCGRQVGGKVEAGNILEIDDQINLLKEELKKNSDPELSKQLAGLEAKRQDYLAIMPDNRKKEYESLSDPLNRAASLDYHLGRIDQDTKNTLVALNDSLRAKGDSLSEKEYQAIRDLLAYKNDPKNDIENMRDDEIVKLRWNEKLGNAAEYVKFWKANPSEAEKKLDEQLLFYERMLERQAAIDEGLNAYEQDFQRNADMVKNYLKDKAWEKAMDEAKKQAFGELLDLVDSSAEAPVTAVLGEALEVVKQEAKSKEFRGLVRAYNLGMAEELAKQGGNIEKAHAAVVAALNNNPYEYEDQNTFAKYGNILENKDCDGSNPHCLQRDVFWKAMKKSYAYQNQAR